MDYTASVYNDFNGDGSGARRGKTPYHLDNKSPHVSRIFSAHSFETSPEPLSKGSSLSVKRGGGQSIFFKATIHDHTFLNI